ncbi:nucleotidyltransferase [Candidatus Chloroploca sp. M-50]|uniref:Nucleotidyltransferase n=1 Tax=Candidatus Chloroploca mongolica TaxID=2528176 RepID=A0ABS4DD66_9CHLR|nr:nucleotidyltransferase [Candidatus Chloroploca mongolica]MBP1467367.1 nucleotidyltransferase [Candidatus Chloroploca mongolica]
MVTLQLPPDFKEFLQLLNDNEVKYLLVGGYAVAYYGYPRATGDIDFWLAVDPNNAARMVAVLDAFGFGSSGTTPDVFLQDDNIVQMGVPPMRIDLFTTLSGVTFADCFARRVQDVIDGIAVNIISLEDLKANKQASGRLKDLNDLSQLP